MLLFKACRHSEENTHHLFEFVTCFSPEFEARLSATCVLSVVIATCKRMTRVSRNVHLQHMFDASVASISV